MPDTEHQTAVYPIGVVQTMTELSGRQLRYYEKMGLLHPDRTKGNQRLYAPDDVERALLIKDLLGQGLNIEGVRVRLEGGEPSSAPTLEARPAATPKRAASPAQAPSVSPTRQVASRLSSLYPVRDQAALAQLLQSRRDALDAAPQPTNTEQPFPK